MNLRFKRSVEWVGFCVACVYMLTTLGVGAYLSVKATPNNTSIIVSIVVGWLVYAILHFKLTKDIVRFIRIRILMK